MQISPEVLGYLAAFCTTCSFLPQAILTIRTKDTQSLSFSMYSLFTFGVILWLIYGLYKKDYALIWANAVTLILASTILGFKIKSMLADRVKRKKP